MKSKGVHYKIKSERRGFLSLALLEKDELDEHRMQLECLSLSHHDGP